MLIDTHVHSNVSFDAKNTRKDIALFALKLGIDMICFTDHYDVINEKSELVLTYDWNNARMQHKNAIQAIPKNSSLKLLYGLELGNASANLDAAMNVLEEDGLDFVIGSIHNTSFELNGLDYYDVSYKDNLQLALQHLDDYFSSLHKLVSWGKYDTLGHLPYPLRYMKDRDSLNLHFADFREQYYNILKLNAEKGRAIEINTDRGKDSLENYKLLLTDWKAVGGEFVTVGADAHKAIDIGKGILCAYELIQESGFKYTTYYKNRIPICIQL